MKWVLRCWWTSIGSTKSIIQSPIRAGRLMKHLHINIPISKCHYKYKRCNCKGIKINGPMVLKPKAKGTFWVWRFYLSRTFVKYYFRYIFPYVEQFNMLAGSWKLQLILFDNFQPLAYLLKHICISIKRVSKGKLVLEAGVHLHLFSSSKINFCY